jgi:hypothetical protein
MSEYATTELSNADEVKAHLRATGVRGPSLHPRVNDPDSRLRWNGCNQSIAYGVDANGNGVDFVQWVFAATAPDGAPYEDFAGGGAGLSHGLGEWVFDRVTWPVHLFPAVAYIEHPEWTP